MSIPLGGCFHSLSFILICRHQHSYRLHSCCKLEQLSMAAMVLGGVWWCCQCHHWQLISSPPPLPLYFCYPSLEFCLTISLLSLPPLLPFFLKWLHKGKAVVTLDYLAKQQICGINFSITSSIFCKNREVKKISLATNIFIWCLQVLHNSKTYTNYYPPSFKIYSTWLRSIVQG